MNHALALAIRILLGLQYLGLAIAGSRMLASPSDLLHSEMGRNVYVWSWFLVIGGVLCLLTSITQLWPGELCGLVLLAGGNITWGWILFTTGGLSTNYGIILIGWGCALIARWCAVAITARGAAQSARRGRG